MYNNETQKLNIKKYDDLLISSFYEELIKLDKNSVSIEMQVEKIILHNKKIKLENIENLIKDLENEGHEIIYENKSKCLKMAPEDYLILVQTFKNSLEKTINKEENQKEIYSEYPSEVNSYSVETIFNNMLDNFKKIYTKSREVAGYGDVLMILYGIKYSKEIDILYNSKIQGMHLKDIIEKGIGKMILNVMGTIGIGKSSSKFLSINEKKLNDYLNDPKLFNYRYEMELKRNISSKSIDEICNILKNNLKKWYLCSTEDYKVAISVLFGIKFSQEIFVLKKQKEKKYSFNNLVLSWIEDKAWLNKINMTSKLSPFVVINETEWEAHLKMFDEFNSEKNGIESNQKYEDEDEFNALVSNLKSLLTNKSGEDKIIARYLFGIKHSYLIKKILASKNKKYSLENLVFLATGNTDFVKQIEDGIKISKYVTINESSFGKDF